MGTDAGATPTPYRTGTYLDLRQQPRTSAGRRSLPLWARSRPAAARIGQPPARRASVRRHRRPDRRRGARPATPSYRGPAPGIACLSRRARGLLVLRQATGPTWVEPTAWIARDEQCQLMKLTDAPDQLVYAVHKDTDGRIQVQGTAPLHVTRAETEPMVVAQFRSRLRCRTCDCPSPITVRPTTTLSAPLWKFWGTSTRPPGCTFTVTGDGRTTHVPHDVRHAQRGEGAAVPGCARRPRIFPVRASSSYSITICGRIRPSSAGRRRSAKRAGSGSNRFAGARSTATRRTGRGRASQTLGCPGGVSHAPVARPRGDTPMRRLNARLNAASDS